MAQHQRLWVKLGILCGLILVTAAAFAELGKDVSSVRSDQQQMQAELRVVPAQGYLVHELRTPTGTTVREFVSPEGTVFAVSWEGAFLPDLRQLLGEHFDEFTNAERSQAGHIGHGIHVETDDLVVESRGHMRFITGRAYLRDKLPSGVTADAIR